MDFWGDRRGQPVQIGFILLFGILVLAFASYQGFVVPNQNAQVEFNHFETVSDQFAEFDTNVVNTIGNDVERSAAFDLGVQYPSRLIALNPPPVSGRLETTAPQRVSIYNGTGDEKTADICGSGQATSRSLVYTPQYNEYGEVRSMTYENTFVTRSFRERDLHGDQRLVRNVDDGPDRIDLLLLNKSVSVDRRGTYSLKIEGSHRYNQRIQNPEVTISTQFSNTVWEDDILADRSDVSVSDAGSDQVRLDFDGGEYQVSCAVIGLDGYPEFTPPGEQNTEPVFSTVWDEQDPVRVQQGEEIELNVEVFERATDARVDDASLDFSIEAGVQDSIATLIDEDTMTVDGLGSVTVDINDDTAGESFGVYVTAGDDGDALTIEVARSLRSASIADIGRSADETQRLTFTPDRDFDADEEVLIDLSEPQGAQQVNYGDASADSESGDVTIIQQGGSTEVVYVASGDESEGEIVEITLDNIDASGRNAAGDYEVIFEGPDGDTLSRTFTVSE